LNFSACIIAKIGLWVIVQKKEKGNEKGKEDFVSILSGF
jgi:hypothetical protein